jgi:TolB-like protein/tetratricopeptide (TPR) repeat protein
MSFWGELKRRNVVKVGIAYAIVAWLLIQVGSVLLPTFEAPDWVMRVFSFALIAGFPVVLVIAWAFELTPDGIKPTSSISKSESITPITGQRLNYVVIGLLLVSVGWLLYRDMAGNSDSATVAATAAPDAAAAVTPAAPARLPNSIAVLLCDNFSTDPQNEFFAASLHEEMLDQLVKLHNLNVIARTSVLQYSAVERPSIIQIAAELNVQSVMECSVAYGDGRIVISAQLIDGMTGLHLWSERYNREFADVFGIQSDIARNVANALAVEFSLEEQRAIEHAPTDSPEAYALYLQGIGVAAVDREASIRSWTRAIAVDPDFAAAHAALANAYAQSIINTIGQDAVDTARRDEQTALAREHAARAVELDPALVSPNSVLGQLDLYSWRWSSALAIFSRDYERDSGSVVGDGRQAFGWLQSYVGNHEQAIEISRRDLELNPNYWTPHWNLAVCLAYAGQLDEARRVQRKAIDLLPAIPVLHSWLAYIEMRLGNEDRALSELRLSEQLLGDNRDVVSLPELAYTYARLGAIDDARRIFNEIERVAGDRDVGAGTWAMAYLAIGDEDRAVEWLETAIAKAEAHEIDQGLFNLLNIRMNMTGDPLLEEPRFVALRNRLRGD